jgi:ABC-type sugar transport system ATPase subunit
MFYLCGYDFLETRQMFLIIAYTQIAPQKMISSNQLRFSYSAQKKFSFPDIHCNDKETLLILGQSGKGKTTLLHLLALLLTPESGDVVIANKPVRKPHTAGNYRHPCQKYRYYLSAPAFRKLAIRDG